ncbi:MAG: DUF1295 domain-containing protein [Paludibacteraceae bacterium]|nr:DUF1295 domain-containing protein [Paludibacteraceae bacterium]MBQ2065708.1 DUF1295 domain-containing protein [Paludibacteraceae bacterium]MBQ4033457.1 DUF1295 domain-containing protein [Paludibacteraceae bacterium]
MGVVGLVVFVCLYFVEAGYGKMISEKWGPAINNKAAWVVMECPVFFVMLYLWATSERTWEIAPLVMFLIFQTHYFQRSFIFPMLLKGKSKMPIFIMLMGVTFNLINGYIQGYWIFYLSPADMYTIDWFLTPMFIIGTCIFIAGICINLHSDHVIRNLRKPGDTKHYLPKDGMYKYVCSANYFGEILEWLGWAILTWSWAGLVFFWWTCANLVPRANAIYKKYKEEFADEFDEKRLKRVIPFIY